MTTIAIHELPPTAAALTPEQAKAVRGGTDLTCMPPSHQPWPMPEGWPFSGEFQMPSMPAMPQLPGDDRPVTAYSPMATSVDPL